MKPPRPSPGRSLTATCVITAVSLAPGTRLGVYEVLSAIGAGGMGEVYRARDTRLQRDVALKLLPAAVAGDPQRLARFEREAQVLASLNHPNIASIYGLEESDGQRAIVMELVEGTRRSARADCRWPRRCTGATDGRGDRDGARARDHPSRSQARQHQADAGRVVKVLDFGLAKALEAVDEWNAEDAGDGRRRCTLGATQVGMVLGTAAYMAPEQAKGRRRTGAGISGPSAWCCTSC